MTKPKAAIDAAFFDTIPNACDEPVKVAGPIRSGSGPLYIRPSIAGGLFLCSTMSASVLRWSGIAAGDSFKRWRQEPFVYGGRFGPLKQVFNDPANAGTAAK